MSHKMYTTRHCHFKLFWGICYVWNRDKFNLQSAPQSVLPSHRAYPLFSTKGRCGLSAHRRFRKPAFPFFRYDINYGMNTTDFHSSSVQFKTFFNDYWFKKCKSEHIENTMLLYLNPKTYPWARYVRSNQLLFEHLFPFEHISWWRSGTSMAMGAC